jgi:NAD(P)H-dependent flavin oxidoreductase YrpB (nitropropane dioxygenase family)
MIMNELLAELEQAGTLRKLWIALRNGLAFREHTGASITDLLRAALAMGRDGELSASQAIMSANAPMIIQKAMVEGEPSRGVLPSGQVAGVIDDLPSCADLIHTIVAEAEQRLAALAQRAGTD